MLLRIAVLIGCLAIHSLEPNVSIAASLNAKSSALFGIQIGEALQLPECHWPLKPDPTLCADMGDPDGVVIVRFPGGKGPPWVKGKEFVARLRDGKVAQLRISTHAWSGGQQDAVRALTEVYGSPALLNSYLKELPFGVKVQSLEAMWTTGAVRVLLEGVTSMDAGMVVVDWEQQYELDQARRKLQMAKPSRDAHLQNERT